MLHSSFSPHQKGIFDESVKMAHSITRSHLHNQARSRSTFTMKRIRSFGWARILRVDHQSRRLSTGSSTTAQGPYVHTQRRLNFVNQLRAHGNSCMQKPLWCSGKMGKILSQQKMKISPNASTNCLLYSKKFSSEKNFVKSDRQAVRQEFIFVKRRIGRFVSGRSVRLLIVYLYIHEYF